MTDPIADMLTRIRNALAKHKEVVEVPTSQLKLAIAQILKDQGFIRNFENNEYKNQGKILIQLKYSSKQQSPINGLKRVSKPGRRVYVGYRDLKPVYNHTGLAILSTPQGVVTDVQAREQKLGGEWLLTIW